MKTHSLWAQKSLGQNFLFDLNITDKIVRGALPLTGCTVLEVGPGPGGLTRPLLWHGAERVIAVEYDPRALPVLKPIIDVVGDRLNIVQDDALKLNYVDLLAQHAIPNTPVKIVANLPYNIGTTLVMSWLEQLHLFSSITVMLQKEVVERFCATPDTKAYGKLSIMAQWLCHATPLFDVPASAFTPPPSITSTVLHLAPRATPMAESNFATMERMCSLLFSQRRKMLRASLKPHFPDISERLAQLGIDETLRAENLTIPQVAMLANALFS